jgi:hypothetical protein
VSRRHATFVALLFIGIFSIPFFGQTRQEAPELILALTISVHDYADVPNDACFSLSPSVVFRGYLHAKTVCTLDWSDVLCVLLEPELQSELQLACAPWPPRDLRR